MTHDQKNGTPLPGNCLDLGQIPVYCFGDWFGDTGDSIPHGPDSVATSLEYQTRTEREEDESPHGYAGGFALYLMQTTDGWVLVQESAWVT